MQTFLQDLRFGLRMSLRKPALTAIAVIALALGIGAMVSALYVTSAVSDKLAIAAPSQVKLEVFYLANEGYFISGGGKKVLVDALFREGIKPYAAVSAPNQERLEKAREPFARIDLALASHFHADHFDPRAVAAHLQHNPRALFVSTKQAVDKLSAFAAVRDRVRAAAPREGERLRFTHNGIALQALYVHHGRDRPVENLGLLFELGGQKLLHIGDAEATAEDFKVYDLPAEGLAVAFVPYWYFLNEDSKRAVREQLRARHLVLMHVPPRDDGDSYIKKRGGWARVLSAIKTEFPNVVWFEREMEKKVFAP